MNTRMTRADEMVDILGDNVMGVETIIQLVQARNPRVPADEVIRSVRASLSRNPDRFERIGESWNYRVKKPAPLVRKEERGQWRTKKDFILAHLNLTISAIIALGKSHGITLTKGTVYTVRSEALKNGADTTMTESQVVETKPTTRGASKTTTTLVRTQATLTHTTLVETTEHSTVDRLLLAILDKEIKAGNIKERIDAVVKERLEVLGREKMAEMFRESAEVQINAFLNINNL